MISTAMPCVATFSTVLISQCTTSALMKQLGGRPFCSGSSWTPVLHASSVNAKYQQDKSVNATLRVSLMNE